MKSIVLEVAPADIAHFKSAIESYDNLATLRTEDPAHHRLRMWFDPEVEDEVRGLITSLRETLSIRMLD